MFTAKVNVRLAIQVPLPWIAALIAFDSEDKQLTNPRSRANDRDEPSIAFIVTASRKCSQPLKNYPAPVPEPGTKTPSACSAC